MAIAKCPKCESPLTSIKVESVVIESGTKKFKGVTYYCPRCKAALSVEIDPLSLQADLVKKIKS